MIMTNFNPIIASDISYVAGFSYATDKKWKAQAALLDEKIISLAANFALFTKENFQSLVPKIRAKLLDKVLEREETLPSYLIDYLDDEACSQLVNQGKHVDKLAQYFLHIDDESSLSLHSFYLEENAISRYVESINEEVKKAIKRIDLSDCGKLKTLSFLGANFDSVEEVDLSRNYELVDLEGLKDKDKLSSLKIEQCSHLPFLDPLKGLPIKHLLAPECVSIQDLQDVIPTLNKLEEIDVTHNYFFRNWDTLNWPSSLKVVKVAYVVAFGEPALKYIRLKLPGLINIDFSYSGADKGRRSPSPQNESNMIRV